MIKNYLLCGVGGQGTVLAAKVLADAAISRGYEVKTTETIGMAQRGGSVVSHVRMGEGPIHSPLIPFGCADMIIGFEPGEALRCLPYLAPGGTMIVSSKAVKPVTASLTGSSYDGSEMIEYLHQQVPELIVVDGEQLCEECGSQKVLNVVLLGAASDTSAMDIAKDELLESLLGRLPRKVHDLNKQALYCYTLSRTIK